MIVPADAAVITNGRPYVGRVAVRTAVVVVAKFPLQSRHVERFSDQTPCLFARPATSHHLALWSARLSRASAERRQLARLPCFVGELCSNGYSSLPAALAVRIVSTTVASASVVVSPSDCPFAMSRRSRRMIFPDRVFGSSGVNMIVFGRAIEPIFATTCSRSSLESASLLSFPARRVTNAKIAWVVTGSSRPITAASATLGCDTSADSTSVVEMRWPEIFITSSTRPMSQKYPSVSRLAASPAKYRPGYLLQYVSR